MSDVFAPMVGKVIAIHVKPGDKVAENDPIITIEAMKMEMPVVAPSDGVVKVVLVKESQNVESDTCIARIE